MLAKELRNLYVEFFTKRGHQEIGSASLFPENDPSVLFTSAGMHPLVPYLLGEKHPLGTKLVNYQKCIRTDDMEEVGDDSHLTYFEMLGNWSLGDYFKKESISMSFTFLTSILNIPIQNISVTVFEGDEGVPRDTQSYQIWRDLGLKENQIYFYGRKENWWGPAGLTGPCGPDTEIFYDYGTKKCGESCGPACKCGKFVEIWNNVFMEYNKSGDGTYTSLSQINVDTGMGLERILSIINGVKTVYETDLLGPIIHKVELIAGIPYSDQTKVEFRIISDHMRAITFILADSRSLVPSNSEQGYILRRLIRRTIRLLKKLKISENVLGDIAKTVIQLNQEVYPELSKNEGFILEQLEKEYTLFNKTLDIGLKKAQKYLTNITRDHILSGELAFKLYDTFGFPIEFTQELAKENGVEVDLDGFRQRFLQHQEKSRASCDGKFSGGLADNSEQTTKLHTATHLLNGALRKVLGESVYQRGSNINATRLRFDFSFERKVTSEELEEVAKMVNEAIQQGIQVVCEEMSVEEGKNRGAIGVFDKKYSELVKVYSIDGYSSEICGGPHVNNTRELGVFTITKEESSSSGVRRIKACVQS